MAYGKPVKPRKGGKKYGVPRSPDSRYGKKGKKGAEDTNLGSGAAGRAKQAIIDRKRRFAQFTDDHQ